MAGTWLDKMLYRVRDAATVDDARIIVRDYMDPATGQPNGDPDSSDQHIHVHLGGGGDDPGGAAGGGDPNGGGDPMNGGGMGGGSVEERLSNLESMMQKLMSMEQQENAGGGGEEEDGEEVELEDPDTKDARRFRMRRGKSLKVKDEGAEIPVPERMPEMVGETDLPGVNDLDKKMSTADKIRRYRSGDSADMEELWSDTVSLGKIILPAIRIPTFDARLTPLRTGARLCAFRRQTLDAALKDETASKIIEEVVGIKTVDGIACDTIKMAFNATAAAMKSMNNGSVFRRSVGDTDTKTKDANVGPLTLAEINRRNKSAWKSGEFTPV